MTCFSINKTTRRQVYDAARQNLNDCDDVLLWNRQRQVTETTIANLVIARDGLLLTPPVHCGLLPGTFRAALVAGRRITPRAITLADLVAAERIWAINSVRLWIPVTAVL